MQDFLPALAALLLRFVVLWRLLPKVPGAGPAAFDAVARSGEA
jgi:hypothetical protein